MNVGFNDFYDYIYKFNYIRDIEKMIYKFIYF